MTGRLTREVVCRWVEESCAAQGVAVKVTDREAVTSRRHSCGRAAGSSRLRRRSRPPA